MRGLAPTRVIGKRDRDTGAAGVARCAPGAGQWIRLAAIIGATAMAIDSELGHSASGPEHAKWSPALREFLAPLIPAPV